MKQQPLTGQIRPLFRILIGLLLAAGFIASRYETAAALTWQWETLDNRERVLLYLDAPGEVSVQRTGQDTVSVTLPAPAQSVTQAPGTAAADLSLLSGLAGQGRTLTISLKDPAFGFITTRPDPRRIQIDFFADPLGRRWRPRDAAVSQAEPAPEAEELLAQLTTPPDNAATEPQAEAPAPQADTPQEPESPAETSSGPTTAPEQPAEEPPLTSPQLAETGQAPLAGGAANSTQPAPGPEPETDIQAEASLRESEIIEPPPSALDNLFSILTGSEEVAADAPDEPQRKPEPPPVFVEEPRPQEVPAAALAIGGTSSPAGAAPAVSDYAFVGEINPGGPQDWPAQPGTATGTEREDPTESTAAPDAPAGVEPTSPDIPPTAGSTPETGPAVTEEITAETVEEIRNPPASTLGQLAQVDAQAAPSQTTPGATAGGQVFGEVVPPPESPAEQESAAAEQAVVQEFDEDGNPIEPPPDPATVLAEAEGQLAARNWEGALQIYQEALYLPGITDEQREAALYGIADATYGLGQDNLPENFAAIVDATERAMNFNLQSPRVPSLLLRLGFVNMKMNNVQEAEAYFNLLKRQYPTDPNIPLTYYYWGDYFFTNNDFRRAADQFQYIVQNYPDSRYVREASLGLARSLYNLGYYEQAYQVGQYIDRRWPRFYVEYPPVLNMFADMALKLDNLDDARRYYWTYYNIAPNGPDADTGLVHLGDIYLAQGKPQAALEVYQKAADAFPDRDGGLIAQMRLAEEGIHDSPDILEMDAIFDKSFSLRPLEVYNRIINDFPSSALAPLATLKLAMWELWNKRYEDALHVVDQFVAKYPDHELLDKAKEVAMTAFSRLTSESVLDDNYDRILRAWDSSAALRAQEESLTPEIRLTLSLSRTRTKQSSDALEVLDPFFRGVKDPEYGDAALALALSTMIDNAAWDQIEPLALRVELWELKPETRNQLNYARALAFENLNQPDRALPLWEELKEQGNLPRQLQAYTLYFLSRAAVRDNQMENAYYLSRQALASLTEIANADPTQADMAKIKALLGSLLDITESSGRVNEALDWYQQYAQYVRETDEEWPSLRFRLAQLHRATGDVDRWVAILTEIKDQFPDTLYGRMAASELDTFRLRETVSDFLPPSGQ